MPDLVRSEGSLMSEPADWASAQRRVRGWIGDHVIGELVRGDAQAQRRRPCGHGRSSSSRRQGCARLQYPLSSGLAVPAARHRRSVRPVPCGVAVRHLPESLQGSLKQRRRPYEFRIRGTVSVVQPHEALTIAVMLVILVMLIVGGCALLWSQSGKGNAGCSMCACCQFRGRW